MFASTSKITFAGAGVAVLAASRANVSGTSSTSPWASIGPDKVNHLRHVEFFSDAEGVRAHMRRHREIIAPKFAAVDAALTAGLDGLEVAEWTHPTGGYFVNLDVLDGTASRVVALAKEAGIALTPAGASSPAVRPARPQHPARSHLPGARRGAHRHGRGRHLRRPRRRREADAGPGRRGRAASETTRADRAHHRRSAR